MSPAAGFHAQLASIMEVLANTAVAEICELVDSGYSGGPPGAGSRKENEVLRRKLRLMELRTARANALRVAATASSTASPHASGRAHHQGNEPRRIRRPQDHPGEVVLSSVCPQAPPSDSGQEPTQVTAAAGESANLVTEVIKVEDDDESPDQDNGFCCVVDEEMTETEAPAPLTNQQAPDEGGGSSRSWMSSEVSSTSMSVQKSLATSQRPETSSYDCLVYEVQLQHGSHSTQNPPSEDPSCSYVLSNSASVSADSGSSSFRFAVGDVRLSVAECQQRAPVPAGQPQLPGRKEATDRPGTVSRRGGWRHQDGVSREDSGGKSFVCNCCGKTLACLKNLKTHMRVHTGEKPFICALCGKRFSDSSNLKRHQSVHTGEKRYGCVHCGKRFAQSGSLKVHMTVHTDCKQFRCSYCGKTFISGSHLRRHITVHGGEKRFVATESQQ
uniref:C2H2-type domain-containing protein n=1 Tax=Monopterus albus TaxID=43700 RepID=A0A3Q3JA00_MONAL|nr:zinc finger and SCAN domain-containing protein 2-like [Monopterus albus]